MPNFVKNLIARGADVNMLVLVWDTNTLTKQFEGILNIAIKHKNVDCVRVLIESGADVNLINGIGETPLHYAADTGDNDIIKLLLEHGANINYQSVNLKHTALHVATFRRYNEWVELLIDQNADIGLLDSAHKSAEDIAMEKGYKDLINIFKNKSIYVQCQNHLVM